MSTKIAIYALIVLLAAALLRFVISRLLRTVAQQIFRMNAKLRGMPHEWCPVDATDYPEVDHQFYKQTQASLEELGFSLLGDIACPAMSEAANLPTCFMRMMASPDGVAIGGFYDFRKPAPPRVFGKSKSPAEHIATLEFSTFLSDGDSIDTSWMNDAALTDDVPNVTRAFAPHGTPAAELLQLHRVSIDDAQRTHTHASQRCG